MPFAFARVLLLDAVLTFLLRGVFIYFVISISGLRDRSIKEYRSIAYGKYKYVYLPPKARRVRDPMSDANTCAVL